MILTVVLLMTMKGPQSTTGDPAQSVTRPYLCNFAKVYRLSEGSHLSVRSSWKLHSPVVDRLKEGEDVYICDEALNEAGHRSYQVYYSGPGHPCAAGTLNGLDEQKRQDCNSGWVSQKWINVISG